jgi:hypothetical protein
MRGIVKERLFTPGPAPVLIAAQVRAATRDLHHRTRGFPEGAARDAEAVARGRFAHPLT